MHNKERYFKLLTCQGIFCEEDSSITTQLQNIAKRDRNQETFSWISIPRWIVNSRNVTLT